MQPYDVLHYDTTARNLQLFCHKTFIIEDFAEPLNVPSQKIISTVVNCYITRLVKGSHFIQSIFEIKMITIIKPSVMLVLAKGCKTA
jgi:hypothetical protein